MVLKTSAGRASTLRQRSTSWQKSHSNSNPRRRQSAHKTLAVRSPAICAEILAVRWSHWPPLLFCTGGLALPHRPGQQSLPDAAALALPPAVASRWLFATAPRQPLRHSAPASIFQMALRRGTLAIIFPMALRHGALASLFATAPRPSSSRWRSAAAPWPAPALASSSTSAPGQSSRRPASNKPHSAEKSTPVWLAIWCIWAGFANSQLRRANFSALIYIYASIPIAAPWAAAQTDANLSAHLHRLPTPPPHLRRMRLLPGRGQVSDGK